MTRPTLMTGLFPLLLIACSSHPAGASADTPGDATRDAIADGTAFTMQVGDSVELADRSELRYLRLIQDSRCPPGKQCVWAGDAIVEFSWAPAGGEAGKFELHTGKEPRSHAIGGRRLVLDSLERGGAPAATLKVESAP